MLLPVSWQRIRSHEVQNHSSLQQGWPSQTAASVSPSSTAQVSQTRGAGDGLGIGEAKQKECFHNGPLCLECCPSSCAHSQSPEQAYSGSTVVPGCILKHKCFAFTHNIHLCWILSSFLFTGPKHHEEGYTQSNHRKLVRSYNKGFASL